MVSTQKENITVNYEGGTPGDIHGIYADISLMNDVLGEWKKVDLHDGIKSMVNSYL